MHTKFIIGISIATLAAAGIGWAVGHPNSHHPATSRHAAQAPAAAPTVNPGNPGALAKLTNTTLTAAGSEMSVGLPATITIEGVGDQVIYANATMDEISQLPAGDAHHLISSIPAAAGYQDVYEMPVTLTILGVTNADGSSLKRAAAGITSGDLSQFSIAVHPGSDPLPSTDTLSTSGCAGLPQSVPTLGAGDTLRWCLHAFSGGSTSSTPVGGQYQAASGPFAAPVTWASKRFASSAEIP